MALLFRSLHPADKPELLNQEWMVVENTGPSLLNAAGWTVSVAKNRSQRPHPLGTLQPGFVIRPGEKIRLVTGSPSKKSQGDPPQEEEGLKSYHLFLREPVLQHAGQVLVIQMKQMELARTVYNPAADDGIARD